MGNSAVDEIVKITGYSSFESVHHYLHLLLHRLHLREDGGWSCIHEGWDAYVLPLQSAWGVTSFWSFAVSPLSTRVSQVFYILLFAFRCSCFSKTWFCLVRRSTAAVRTCTCFSRAVGCGSSSGTLLMVAINRVSTMQLFCRGSVSCGL